MKIKIMISVLLCVVCVVSTNIFLSPKETDSLVCEDFKSNTKEFITATDKKARNKVHVSEITMSVEEETSSYEEWIESLNLWEYGWYVWGISYEDTDRILRLVTHEGYGQSLLSYYVACCSWVRVTEDYWGYGNLYTAFGEVDEQYGTWMDELGIADWAYEYVWWCYIDPTYCRYCNGMCEPYDYIYCESNIYCWN